MRVIVVIGVLLSLLLVACGTPAAKRENGEIQQRPVVTIYKPPT